MLEHLVHIAFVICCLSFILKNIREVKLLKRKSKLLEIQIKEQQDGKYDDDLLKIICRDTGGMTVSLKEIASNTKREKY